MAKQTKKKATAAEIDRIADEGQEDLNDYLDTDAGIKRVSVDFPLWMLAVLDDEAKRLGIPRQAVIKNWIDERIQQKGLAPKPEKSA